MEKDWSVPNLLPSVWRGLFGIYGYIREEDQMKKEEGNISLFLARSENDGGSEEFQLQFELSVIGANGSSLKSEELEHTFKTGIGCGWSLEIDEILLCRKADYVPKDTLTLHCKIRRGEGNLQQIKQITGRTRIGIKRISFLHVTESFNTLKLNQKKTVKVTCPSKKGLDLTCNLYFTDDSWCEGKVMVEIKPSDTNHILSARKLSLLDGSGKLIPSGEADSRFDATRRDIQRLPLSLTRQLILSKKNEYLPENKLTLLCECAFSTGVEYKNIETTLHEIPVVVLNQMNENDQNKSIFNTTEKLSTCSSGLDDLKALYSDQFLTDVELKTKTKSFPAHKIVLCARSSVFKATLTIDMKERHTNCIQMDDMEDNIVHQLLLFLYSDNLENLEWESAMKLYYAGDKYAIEKLKVMCASFLVKNLTTSAASELLLLADTHNDSDLKKAVEDFIFKHEKQVYGSDEWINLIETNSLLVSKTMCLKYRREL